MKSKLRAPLIAAAAAVIALSGPVAADARDCDALPRSALKMRSCNPQAECRASIPNGLRGAAREKRERECDRLPRSGLCGGPDRYDPQADCRTERRK